MFKPEENRAFVEKMQNLPEKKKKIILWTIVAVLAIIMGIFWVIDFKNNLSKITKGINNIEIPKIENQIQGNIPINK